MTSSEQWSPEPAARERIHGRSAIESHSQVGHVRRRGMALAVVTAVTRGRNEVGPGVEEGQVEFLEAGSREKLVVTAA